MSPAVEEQQQQQSYSKDSAAAARLDHFLIWPVLEKLTQDQVNSTDAAIRKIVGGPDPTVIEKTLNSDGELNFWYCPLNAKQKAAISKLDAVAEVQKDGPDPDFQLC
ncbi:hypothetical protein LTR78_007341 [Recurvomyces mirabilis]|uniref:Uncharacterized protein n=1 Tax=Recurvomyces mirabilis TaxID=574656 RepID=A0AAE0WI71_9PEZI|nr:hypothetical protein LTR78_007341 [Recurvomyces mirabilis]KAK5155072.1 hypothetical protein LTS14_006027 [Recurvomyces mirabilis]